MYDNSDIRELKAAAFETLMFFPGCDRKLWIDILLKEYTEEVALALGADLDEITETLNDWWDNMSYTDDVTEITRIYKDWAKIFAKQEGVDFYRSLVARAVKEKDL